MKKQTIWLLAIIVILSISMVLGYFFQSSMREKRKNTAGVFTSLDIKSISEIVINKDIVLNKKDNEHWVTEDKELDLEVPVNEKTLNNLLESLKNFPRGRLISKEPSDLSKYSLVNTSDYNKEENKSTFTLEVKNETKTLASLVISKDDPGYVIVNDEKAVYLVPNTLTSFLDNDLEYWHRLSIAPKNLEEVNNVLAINVNIDEVKDKSFELTNTTPKKKKSTWESNSDIQIDSQKVDDYIEKIIKLNAVKFSNLELDDDMYSADVIIKTVDDQIKISIYEFSNTFYAKVFVGDEKPQYSYELTESIKNTLLPELSKFEKPEEDKDEEKDKES